MEMLTLGLISKLIDLTKELAHATTLLNKQLVEFLGCHLANGSLQTEITRRLTHRCFPEGQPAITRHLHGKYGEINIRYRINSESLHTDCSKYLLTTEGIYL